MPTIPEFDEPFAIGQQRVFGDFSESDECAPAGDPGMLTRVARLLLEDGDAELLPQDAVMVRIKTGVSYRIKTPKKSGVGLTELELARLESSPFERNF